LYARICSLFGYRSVRLRPRACRRTCRRPFGIAP
jgi:hypothetical protein